MPIGAIAAGVAKVGVFAGRTAVKVGTKVAKEGIKAGAKVAKKGADVAQKGVKAGVKRAGKTAKQTIEKGKKLNDQRKKFQESYKEKKKEPEEPPSQEEDDEDEELKKMKRSRGQMPTTMDLMKSPLQTQKGKLGSPGMAGMKGGYMGRNLRVPQAKGVPETIKPIGMNSTIPPSLKGSPFLKGAGQKIGGQGMIPPGMKGGYMARRTDNRPQANGMRMSDQARSQAMMRRQSGTGQPRGLPQDQQKPQKPGEGTKEEFKKRDARENVIEAFIQSGGMAMRSIEFGTVGVGLLATMIPRMMILGRKNHQMLYGDIICKGKNKNFGGLEYRGALSVLKYLDKSGMGLKLMVILSNLLLVIMFLIVLSGMCLIVVAIASPAILLSIGLEKILGGF